MLIIDGRSTGNVVSNDKVDKLNLKMVQSLGRATKDMLSDTSV